MSADTHQYNAQHLRVGDLLAGRNCTLITCGVDPERGNAEMVGFYTRGDGSWLWLTFSISSRIMGEEYVIR
jgi:hypothetical protein